MTIQISLRNIIVAVVIASASFLGGAYYKHTECTDILNASDNFWKKKYLAERQRR